MGSGGDGERWGADRGPRGSLNEQIAVVLMRLQEDMQNVLHRLHMLEAVAASQVLFFGVIGSPFIKCPWIFLCFCRLKFWTVFSSTVKTFQLYSVAESNLKFPTGTYSQEHNSSTCKPNHAFLT